MESFIAGNKKYGRNVDYLALDDSSSVESRRKTRRLLSARAEREKVSIFYAGEEEKRKFARELIRAGSPGSLPEEAVDFALFDVDKLGAHFGANRNALLLATAGETAGEIADDTVYRFAEPFEKKNGLEFFSFFDPTEIDFFPDRQTLLESVEFSDQDILLRHEDLLGRTVAGCLSRQGPEDPVRLNRIRPSFTRLLESGRAKVLVTLTGVAGDSGLCSRRMILGLRGESRKRLMCSQSDYFSATTSREVLRAVKRYTISEGPLCVSALLGLDNRWLLPPFFPVMRNEDGILAVTLRTCFKGGLIGHLPLTALHDPSEPRRFAPEAIREMKPRIAEVISLLVQSWEPGPGVEAPEESLQTLGKYLMELGILSKTDFAELVKIKWMSQLTQYIDYLENSLAAYDSTPEYWAGDVRAHLEATRAL